MTELLTYAFVLLIIACAAIVALAMGFALARAKTTRQTIIVLTAFLLIVAPGFALFGIHVLFPLGHAWMGVK